jgi:hypothetical protein
MEKIVLLPKTADQLNKTDIGEKVGICFSTVNVI